MPYRKEQVQKKVQVIFGHGDLRRLLYDHMKETPNSLFGDLPNNYDNTRIHINDEGNLVFEYGTIEE